MKYHSCSSVRGEIGPGDRDPSCLPGAGLRITATRSRRSRRSRGGRRAAPRDRRPAASFIGAPFIASPFLPVRRMGDRPAPNAPPIARFLPRPSVSDILRNIVGNSDGILAMSP